MAKKCIQRHNAIQDAEEKQECLLSTASNGLVACLANAYVRTAKVLSTFASWVMLQVHGALRLTLCLMIGF